MQGLISIIAPLEVEEIQLLHRLHVRQEAVLIVYRCDVDDNEPLHPRSILEREHHGDLPAHAVADERHGPELLLADEGMHVLGHLAITHRIGPRRGAVVAQVQGVNAMPVRQAFGNGLPVPARPEEAVQNQNGLSRSVLFVGQCYGHCVTARLLFNAC